DAKMYITIIGGGVFLQGIFMTYSAIFRSNGFMKQGMYISVLVNILNIIGNLILLNGYFGLPKMGIAGVAISSVVSRLFGVIIIMYIFKKNIKGKVSLIYLFPFPKDIFKSLMKIGVPSGGEAISYNVSQMVILTFINTMGITVITTKSYLNIITWLSYLFASAVSQANQIRVAYLIGAGDEDEADKKVRETLKLANLVTLVVASLVYIFSDELFGIFTQNPEILKLGKTILLIDIILEIARTGVLVLIRGMQGAGDIKYPIFIGIASMWSVATLFSYIFGVKLGWGLQGVWIAMLADECLRATIFWFRWKSGKWRARKII
ncbi:MAG: MATE family efflux transporter, partial [Clostridium sp.]